MNVLIIHTAFVGDIILSTPFIEAFHEKYPSATLHYLTTPAGATLLKNHPSLSGVIVYDKRGKDRGVKGFLKLAKKLKGMNFSRVYIFHRYFRSVLLATMAGIPERVGYDISGGSYLLTKKIVYEKSFHEVERLFSFDSTLPAPGPIRLYSSKEATSLVEEWLGEIKKPIIVLAPGSRWMTKRWPVEYMNELIKSLTEDGGYQVVIVGGKEEELLELQLFSSTLDLRGKTSLLEVFEIMKRSKVVVTNDSAPAHLAAATQTHIIAIFGATTPSLGFSPWSKNSEIVETILPCRPCGLHGGTHCPEKHFNCMRLITPEEVLEKVKRSLP